MFVDTHCHIHSVGYKLDPAQETTAAKNAGVSKILLVGEDVADSKLAIAMAETDELFWATVGVHPHEAEKAGDIKELEDLLNHPKVVAIGECGLDYWYQHSPRDVQQEVLRYQIDLAISNQLPMSLHIRGSKDNPDDAFSDFFKMCDEYHSKQQIIRGVVHSFSSRQAHLEGVLSRGLYVGLNGIATFADPETQEVIKNVPLESMVLETDAPYLTPVPERGKVNAPKYVVHIAEFIAKQRGKSLQEIADATTANANQLFKMEV